MITRDQCEEFDEQGYLVVRGLLDVAEDIAPCGEAYAAYLDTLTDIYRSEMTPPLSPKFRARPFGERVAILMGCSGGDVLQHLDPALSVLLPSYRWRKDLPSAQRPELFGLMRSVRLLDALERLVGPEVSASPVYHVNLKLPRRMIRLAVKAAEAAGRVLPGYSPLWRFHVGSRPSWHTDAAYGFRDAFRSRIVNAWIPMTPATLENSCLVVSPGSHRLPPERTITSESVTAKAVPLPAEPGDVIFMDNRLAHTALDNRTEDQIRWAFNVRYLPTGEPTGRPFLPSFIARSRAAPDRELDDPELWSAMWGAALDYVSTNPNSRHLGQAPDDAERITARWQAATRDHADWLTIANHPQIRAEPSGM